jgi:hypothetical protein
MRKWPDGNESRSSEFRHQEILAEILESPQLVTDNLAIVFSPLLFFPCLRLRFLVGFEVAEGSSSGWGSWDTVVVARQMTKTGPIYPNGYNPTS